MGGGGAIDVTSMYDLGFLGVEDNYANGIISTHQKEEESGINERGRRVNRNHSAKRIVIEHAICRIKKYKIMNDVFRNRLRKYDKASDIVSGLVNYRILNIC